MRGPFYPSHASSETGARRIFPCTRIPVGKTNGKGGGRKLDLVCRGPFTCNLCTVIAGLALDLDRNLEEARFETLHRYDAVGAREETGDSEKVRGRVGGREESRGGMMLHDLQSLTRAARTRRLIACDLSFFSSLPS